MADDPYGEAIIDAVLDEKWFGEPEEELIRPDAPDVRPPVDPPRMSGDVASSSSGAVPAVPTPAKPKAPRSAWREHVGVWRAAVLESLSAIEMAGKDSTLHNSGRSNQNCLLLRPDLCSSGLATESTRRRAVFGVDDGG